MVVASLTGLVVNFYEQVFSFPVESGDVIVAGTDGLFDNLYNSEITAVVVQGIRAGLRPQVMAQKIAALARRRAQDKKLGIVIMEASLATLLSSSPTSLPSAARPHCVFVNNMHYHDK
ncbi:hypothetical protein B296_00030040, partial [Ensete ventricosum]